MDAIDLLELTPHEIEHAKRTLLNRISPSAVNPEHIYERWFAPSHSKLAIRMD